MIIAVFDIPERKEKKKMGNREPDDLTKREIEVLEMIMVGKSSTEVANELFLSRRTVDFHLANAYLKLGVKNRMAAGVEWTKRKAKLTAKIETELDSD